MYTLIISICYYLLPVPPSAPSISILAACPLEEEMLLMSFCILLALPTYPHGCGVIHWSMNNLPTARMSKESPSFTAIHCQ